MKHRAPSSLEREQAFLRHQAELAQAVSGKAELNVSIGLNRLSDDPLTQQETIQVYQLAGSDDATNARHMRGQVDLAALAIKYHAADLHHSHRPLDDKAATMFDALEQVRLEAIGVEQFPGMRANLEQRHVTAFDLHHYARPTLNPDTALPDVVAMIAREAITGAPPPANIAALVATMRPWVEQAALAHLGKLPASIHSQTEFFAPDAGYSLRSETSHSPPRA